MNSLLRVSLNTNAEQHARLMQLQAAFTEVCNALAPTVQQTRTWNRVALHHLSYHPLRERFPAIGSQMICNAIYSVSRTCRLVFQHPQSPFNINRLSQRPFPLLRFEGNCPVYFDRHTLSINKGQLSMYTLDGRLHFALALSPSNESDFIHKKLREIALTRQANGIFELLFQFGDDPTPKVSANPLLTETEFPEYIMVEEAA